MKQKILHDEWEEKVIARVAGELSAEEGALLDQHLDSCASCVQQLREYEFLTQRLCSVERDIVVPAPSLELLALRQEIVQYCIQEEAHQIVEETLGLQQFTEVLVLRACGGSQDLRQAKDSIFAQTAVPKDFEIEEVETPEDDEIVLKAGEVGAWKGWEAAERIKMRLYITSAIIVFIWIIYALIELVRWAVMGEILLLASAPALFIPLSRILKYYFESE